MCPLRPSWQIHIFEQLTADNSVRMMRAFLKALPAQATQPNTTAVGQQATAFGANSSAPSPARGGERGLLDRHRPERQRQSRLHDAIGADAAAQGENAFAFGQRAKANGAGATAVGQMMLRGWSYYHLRDLQSADRIFKALAATGNPDAQAGIAAILAVTRKMRDG